jgi:hypothetical protein
MESVKTSIIIVLLVLLLTSVLGINMITPVFQWAEKLIMTIWDFIKGFLVSLGYSTGEIVNASSNTVANVAKTGIDVTNGAVMDAGNLMKGQTGNLDQTIQSSHHAPSDPKPSSSDASDRPKWCFLEKKDGKNHCVEVASNDKCDSGKLFESEAQCLK